MKLLHLLLPAFGPFTDLELDFGSSEQDQARLHLIHGPNEAGKSSALRAITDLRYGIPTRSSDDFIHKTSALRIAGIFQDPRGERIGLVRRKGRGQTLSRFDPDQAWSDAGEPVTADIEQALTGGLARADFERQYGLDHQRLRAGGEALLAGKGELGSTLFEASAGGGDIKALLAALEQEARDLFMPGARGKNALINQAFKQLDNQRKLLRESQTRSSEWRQRNQAHDAAREALTDIDRRIETLNRRQNDLTELRAVEPVLRIHDQIQADLHALAKVPDLPEQARQQRRESQRELDRALTTQREIEEQLQANQAEREKLVIERPLLEQAETLERLAGRCESIEQAALEIARGEQAIRDLDATVLQRVQRIAPEQSPTAVLAALPSAADQDQLELSLNQIEILNDRLTRQQDSQRLLITSRDADPEAAQPAVDAQARATLIQAIRRAQALGDVTAALSAARRDTDVLERRLGQALHDLGLADVAALRASQPLLPAEIDRERTQRKELDQSRQAREQELARLARELSEQQRRQSGLAAQGEIVTAETLAQSRARRDQGWQLIRQGYIETRSDPTDLAKEFDTGRDLPEAFEAAQDEADRQADLLREGAERAAQLADCAARIRDLQEQRQATERQLDTHLLALRTQMQAWQQRLSDLNLPDLEPEALKDWQAKRDQALELAERLAREQRQLQDLQSQERQSRSGLQAALTAVGQVPAGDHLSDLIGQATTWDKALTEAQAGQRERAKTREKQRLELARLSEELERTRTELGVHQQGLADWSARLFLSNQAATAVVKKRLDELRELVRLDNERRELRQRLGQSRVRVEIFEQDTRQLNERLGETSTRPSLDQITHLAHRLKQAQEAERRAQVLQADIDRLTLQRRQVEKDQQRLAAELERLCRQAGVDDPDQLNDVEDQAARKRALKDRLAAQRDQLREVSRRSESDLRATLADFDQATIEARLEGIAEELRAGRGEQEQARQSLEEARQALQAIDSSDQAAEASSAMQAAATRIRDNIQPWARLKLAQALLKQAMERYRESAQGPMIATASRYFGDITGQRFERLLTDSDGDHFKLLARRPGGELIGVEAMSEGTRDQLYLALRLAALELRRQSESHQDLPLILDDVLITSDDARGSNILRALAQFGAGGQVMLFTHHQHLVDLARECLDANALQVVELAG